MKQGISALLTIPIIAALSSCTTTIYLVRHGEKNNGTDTSTLTVAGSRRAIALRDTLQYKGIDAIYASPLARTQLTAQPLATALNKRIKVYDLNNMEAFATRLEKLNRKKVLVVGHTTNIPHIIKFITGDIVQVPEDDFDNLFVIRIRKFMTTRYMLEQKTYGAPTP